MFGSRRSNGHRVNSVVKLERGPGLRGGEGAPGLRPRAARCSADRLPQKCHVDSGRPVRPARVMERGSPYACYVGTLFPVSGVFSTLSSYCNGDIVSIKRDVTRSAGPASRDGPVWRPARGLCPARIACRRVDFTSSILLELFSISPYV
ncbi:unnamed protein product [Danaus chrysippus]|uniref:(African queen) hypothetical protein n=1 Tax=Danaus chrysippus TaxID=151541 RepID=A0A8J2VSD0_9NEOP|nr:unnamed protein product [Danaus chrysippus]